ncbi:non-ribosomal peptide synthetase [Streptomyces scabiei]|uniref:non-ribosomal peptide synthetase n=1 Tax=Streptomyces scabiei TaxID=1930 RepID=UPI00068A2A55|nr:non-ribosomal peptide synthetase [Streptomyces scabiei]
MTDSAGRPSVGAGRAERLARLTPEQRAEFEARARGITTPEQTRARPAKTPAAPPRAEGARPPLSFGQERLWFLDQLAPGLGVFNEYVALRLTGPLDLAALDAALVGLVARHEALRTVIDPADGVAVQRILAPSPESGPGSEPVLTVVDVGPEAPGGVAAAERALAVREAARPFDLEGERLFRALLIRSGPGRALLVVVNHHMVGDAWSRAVLVEELCAGYRAFRGAAGPADDGESTRGPAPEPLPLQYADWATRQRGELNDEALAQPLAYWRDRLAGAPPLLGLATDRPRPVTPTYRGGRVHFTLDRQLTEGIEAAAREARATPFMVTLAAWQAVLMRHSGQQDVSVGVPTAGRDRPELAGMVGMFVNSLVMRTDLSGDPSFGELIGRARETALGALAHAQVPFERLVRDLSPDRDLSHAPLYQVQFGYRNVPEPAISLPGVTVELFDLDNGLCRVDLSLELARSGDVTAGVCEFSTDLFDESTARGFTDVLERVLRRGTADPSLPLSELLALTSAEEALLEAAGDGGPLPANAEDVLASFAGAVRARPDAEAVLLAADPAAPALTYGRLDARVAEIHARLLSAGVRPGDRVGVCLRRGADLPAALFAVLRAGAAYLPIDPAYPADRIRYVLEDAAPAAVLVQAATREAVPPVAPLLDLDAAPSAPAGPASADAAPDPEAPAYVIHTSGSTGRPKGVVVLRRNLTAFLAAMDRTVTGETAGEGGETITWLAVTSVSFDISVLELLWTLSRGHRLVLSPDSGTPDTRAPAQAPVHAPAAILAASAEVPEFSLFYFSSDSAAHSPGPDQYRLLIEGARFADSHGFSAVWLPERHFHAFGGSYPAPSVLAAALAQRTERIGIRAGSVVLPLHHPVRVAEEWSVVDNLSGGRVGLSFASGWHMDDFVLAKDAYDDRQNRMVDGIDEVRRLWRGEHVAFEGPAGRSVDVAIMPRPVQPELPFWLTSSGNPETCRKAGEVGAGLLTHLLGQSVEELAEKIAVYREAWKLAGHAGEPHVTLMLHTFVGTDAEDVRAHARQPFRDYLRSSVGLIEKMARALGIDISADDFTADDQEALLDHAAARYVADGSFIGTVEDRLPLLRRLAGAGVDEVACLIDFGVDPDAALRALSGLAALRDAAAPAAPDAAGADEVSLTRMIRTHGVTHLQCTPSLARALLDEPDAGALGGLRRLLLGGEPLDVDLVGRLRGHLTGTLRNMYGPTETTVWSTSDTVDPAAGTVTIGRPIAGTTVRVLDEHGRRTPVGVPGELYIGGAGVTAGYLGRPELTAERFVPDGSREGNQDGTARLYRTGDVVRVRPDGRLDYLARNDNQLKIRGFRIEAGEVEAALNAVPGVRQSVVTAHGLGTSRASLIAYVVPETPDAPPAPAELRTALAALLPAFLVPSRFLVLDSLPLTHNGKVDRGALPSPDQVARTLGADRVAPSTPTEERVAAIWREALGIEQVGVHEDFFELGGHSLLATQVVAGIRRQFAIRLALRTLFEAPTVAALARSVDALSEDPAHRDASERAGESGRDERSGHPVALRPDPATRYEPFPLTEVQRAYWIGRSGAVGGDVSCHFYVELDVDDVDLDRLEGAWQSLVRRHDALRLVVDADGTQRILPDVPGYRIDRADLRGLPAAEREDRLRAVRDAMSHHVLPAETWPLFQIRASRTERGAARLHFSIDTLIADGGSVQILLRELLAVYRGELDPRPLELSFRDYVLAEHARREGPAHERDLAYWRKRLDTLPPAPPLPLVRRLDELVTTRFRRREAHLPADLWARLKARAAAARITPSALSLAAYATVLGTWSATDRFTLNLTLFNRVGDHPELGTLVGDFTALSLLEVDRATSGSFEARARSLQDRLWEDLDHQLVGGVRVAGELARRRGVAAAAMPVVFTSELGAADVGGTPTAGLGARVAHTITQTPQVWLDHQISEDEGRLRLTWDAVEALFPPGMLDDMFGAYTGLLTSLATDAGAWSDPHREVLPQDQAVRHRELNSTEGPLPEGLLHEPFLENARRSPGRTAVISANGTFTYSELEEASRAVAHTLRQAGVTSGDIVGVIADRGREQVAAAIGVLRAGAAYLPLDAGLPSARIADSLRHAGAVTLIVPPSAATRAPAVDGVPVIRFDEAVATGSGAVLEPLDTDPGALAYVIYTSGSTGEPKGVMTDHRGALNTVTDINERFEVGAEDRVFGLSSLGFDLSVYDVFGTFAAGATLVLAGPGEERDPVRWTRLIAEHGVTVWNSVPALMEMLLAHAAGNAAADAESLRLVMLSGDWIPVGMPDQVKALAPKTRVISLGGATEASIWSVLHPIGRVDPERSSIPYGRPMRNQTMYVLDDAFRLRPTGLPGALYIGGVGVAVGYRNAPELTARAFPIHPVTGERLYRTGDLARLLPDGDLEFLGREDSQVKVRGMRIELGEIEAALVRTDGVREAAALVEGEGMSARLAAYVVREAARPAQRTDVTGPGTAGAQPSAAVLGAEQVRRLEHRLRQPGRRADLVGREILPFVLPADTLTLRTASAGQGAATAFGAGSVPAADVYALLTTLARQDDDGVPRYAFGSAGGLYPVQTYLAVAPGGVDGIPAGVYYLDPAGPALVALDGERDAGRALEPALFGEANRALVTGAGFGIFLVSRDRAITQVYGALADRFCLLEAGAMAQLLRQRAADCRIGLCPIGDVYEEPLHALLRLEEDQTVLHTLVGGRPAAPAVPGDDAENWAAALRAELAVRLPGYMVPQRLSVIDALPLSANGKVDRKALAAGTAGATAAPPVALLAPASTPPAAALLPDRAPLVGAVARSADSTIDRLVELWREVLEGQDLGIDTNFFESGATSIHLVRVQRRVTEEFGREVSVVDMFDGPTIRHLAELLDRPEPSAGTARPTPHQAEQDAGPTATPVDEPVTDRRQHHERRRAARRRGGSGPSPAN